LVIILLFDYHLFLFPFAAVVVVYDVPVATYFTISHISFVL